ncbi:MAG: hypothetical protein ACKVS6_15365, partial [Planctomycetota bacterium]
ARVTPTRFAILTFRMPAFELGGWVDHGAKLINDAMRRLFDSRQGVGTVTLEQLVMRRSLFGKSNDHATCFVNQT